jgi:ribosomal protein L32
MPLVKIKKKITLKLGPNIYYTIQGSNDDHRPTQHFIKMHGGMEETTADCLQCKHWKRPNRISLKDLFYDHH